jgi:hypothetical protein
VVDSPNIQNLYTARVSSLVHTLPVDFTADDWIGIMFRTKAGASMSTMDFLYALANNPSQALKFKRDPFGTARSAGLSEETAKLLASRDSQSLRRFLSEGTEAAFVYTTESAVIYTTESAMVYTVESALIYTSEAA